MTGFGKGASGGLTVEIKSVNNRFLEVNSRLPKTLNAAEIPLKKLVSEHVKRGSVDIYVLLNSLESNHKLCVDAPLVREYVRLAKSLEQEGVANDFSFSCLLRCADVIKPDYLNADETKEQLMKDCLSAAKNALTELEKMRINEGRVLKGGLTNLLNELYVSLDLLKQFFANSVQEIKEKLSSRIKELLADVQIDEARLVNEAAFLADKADITEELLRLDSHLIQFKNEMELNGDMGRKLEFLTQEISREINTIGSKTTQIQIGRLVVEMKNTLEKIKEQVRNVE